MPRAPLRSDPRRADLRRAAPRRVASARPIYITDNVAADSIKDSSLKSPLLSTLILSQRCPALSSRPPPQLQLQLQLLYFASSPCDVLWAKRHERMRRGAGDIVPSYRYCTVIAAALGSPAPCAVTGRPLKCSAGAAAALALLPRQCFSLVLHFSLYASLCLIVPLAYELAPTSYS